jgi:hypothetical protein
MGGSKTEASEEFKSLVAETEKQKTATEALSEAVDIYIKTLSKRKESKVSKGKKMPLELLSESMSNYASMLESNSAYGKALDSFSDLTSKLSAEQNDYQGKIRDGFGGSLSHSMVCLFFV